MRKHPKSRGDSYFVPTANPGTKPGDFPVGSLRSRAAARAIVASYADEQRKEEEAQLANLTPLEQATIEDVESRSVQILMLRLFRVAQATEKVYGLRLPWPTPEEIRHNRAVHKELDRMTGGRASSVGGSQEWDRLKAIAEENLRKKAGIAV